MKIYKFILILSYTLISCQNRANKNLHSVDKRSSWLLDNENNLNVELNKRIVNRKIDTPKNYTYDSTTIIITKYDSSILGQFAKLISDYDSCLLITYTFTPDTNNRKIIGYFSEDSVNCKANADSILAIDSTEHFKIQKILFTRATYK